MVLLANTWQYEQQTKPAITIRKQLVIISNCNFPAMGGIFCKSFRVVIWVTSFGLFFILVKYLQHISRASPLRQE